jgi:hypothetical protein
MTDITPAVAAVEASGTPALASPPKTPAGVTPPVGQSAISWHMPTPSQWVAYRGHTRIGSIHQLGAFIATNQHMDVIGAFVELSSAQLAIADPHPADADLVRRSHARRLQLDARLRRATLATMTVLIVVIISVAVVLLARVR